MTALTAVLVLAGCLGTTSQPGADPSDEAPVDEAAFQPVNETFQGEFLAGGVDQPHAYTFPVPNGTTEVMGLLTWSIPGADLSFQLVDPDGEVQATGWAESGQHQYVTTTHPPTPGNWTVVVTAEQGADVHYEMAIEARKGEPFGPIEQTYTVDPQGFVEINLNMAPGDAFTFDWQADGELAFNVHYHADGETERPIEHTGTELAGNFSAPRTQVYSLLWSNEGALPVEVTASVDGSYRLHSMTRDQPGS